MNLQPHIDELGHEPGNRSHDEPLPPRLSLHLGSVAARQNHGVPQRVVDEVVAAIDREDAADDNELDQRRYEMERTLASNEKDRLLIEMADLICRMSDLLYNPNDHAQAPVRMAARLISGNPRIHIDTACLISARNRLYGKPSAAPSREEVRNWQP